MMNQRQRTLELSEVFESVLGQLQNDRQRLNDLDRNGGNGNHGDNMVNNFQLIANALRASQGQDAQTQLQRAARALQEQGRGATAGLYAQGLRQAGQQLAGRQGIGMNDLLPLLQGLLGGVQQQTTAQPGQGTLLDSLLPAVTSFAAARSGGQSAGDAIVEALGAATRGSQQIYNQPATFGSYRRTPNQSWQDPGASSATSVLEGLFRQFVGR